METIESRTDYDLFDYESDKLSLGEAIKLAQSLRSVDRSHRFRIVPANNEQTSFRVEVVEQGNLYANFLGSIAGFIARATGRAVGR